jgi:hypothetical protein
MSEAQKLIQRLLAQGCFKSDLQIEKLSGCTCSRSETETPGLMQFEFDENCPIHIIE